MDVKEEEFKNASKVAQSLCKSTPPDQVQEMLGELKMVKERLVNVRKMVPERLKPLKSVLPQIESLEIGVQEISQWLQAGQALLESHRIDGNINKVEERLDSHKVSRYQTITQW